MVFQIKDCLKKYLHKYRHHFSSVTIIYTHMYIKKILFPTYSLKVWKTGKKKSFQAVRCYIAGNLHFKL